MTKLNAYNESNEREISSMVGKAMCAWANWQTALKYWEECVDAGDKHGMHVHERAASGYVNEYEATARCIELFVRESLPQVCAYVIDKAKAEFGI